MTQAPERKPPPPKPAVLPASLSSEARAAMVRRANPYAYLLVYLVLALFVVGLAWSYYSDLEIVTTGQGRVIPSSKVQVIQNLEGGILEELLVAEGDLVARDQVLVRINDVNFSSNQRENRARALALQAAIARGTAEVTGVPPRFPPQIARERPDFVRSETALYEARQRELNEGLGHMLRSLESVRDELKLSEPLVKQGALAEVEILRLRRQESELLARVDDRRNQFRSGAQGDLIRSQVELTRVDEAMVAVNDRVRRTTVRSPVKGLVKKLNVTTPGGVIPPGSDIMEIVPIEDTLLVETRILPGDIGFIQIGQGANVKISAYDYSIYGGLPGRVEHISADAISDAPRASADARANETYYRVLVRTEKNSVEGADKKLLMVIPGMTASVDILTGHRTVLRYLLQPFIRAKDAGMRER